MQNKVSARLLSNKLLSRERVGDQECPAWGTLLRPFGLMKTFCLFVFVMLLVCAGEGLAQTGTGSICGTIRDS